ncbi:MAG: alpha-L-rhamnosidase, partial [Opitutaceae bacterium]|nr:alpha-L-rhamnosidase [Opitutaceae bacterium]
MRFPDFSCTFRIKPYLVDERERLRNNTYNQPALIVTDLFTECDQKIELVPTAGQIIWFSGNRKLVRSSGWARWPGDPSPKTLRLHKGANRLVGVHVEGNHFQDVNLAAFAPHPVQPLNPFGKGGFQVILAGDTPLLSGDGNMLSDAALELIETGTYPEMDTQHTLIDANPQDLVVNARPAAAASGAGVPPASGVARASSPCSGSGTGILPVSVASPHDAG